MCSAYFWVRQENTYLPLDTLKKGQGYLQFRAPLSTQPGSYRIATSKHETNMDNIPKSHTCCVQCPIAI
jgi:hypothetical protein